jgi:Ca2+-dependent lipid-binding protein
MAQLQVTVIEGRSLKKKDLFSESDPFVQMYLDDKKHKQITKAKSNTKNPQWNQTFVL